MPQIYEHIPLLESGAIGEPIQRVEYGDGIKVFLKGHPYPLKGMPTQEAMFAVDIVKKLLMFKWKDAMQTALKPYLLKPEYMGPFARELRRMFPGKLGTTIATVLDYDNAYRLRIQDLCKETTKEKLLAHPFREVQRLLKINQRRDYPEVHFKFKRFAPFISILLCIRRKTFRECNWDQLLPDESDLYWLSIRTDYHYDK